MTWNWQQPDWPNFSWDAERLAEAERQFLVGGGVLLGSIKHLTAEDQTALIVEAMSSEALTTSEIEGEILDRASVQSSIRKQFGLQTDSRRVSPAEAGVSDMMVDLYRTSNEELTDEMLHRWHEMIMRGRRDLVDVGRYRTVSEPMQIVSGRIDLPEVHFEAPPSSSVKSEMADFIQWFNSTQPHTPRSLPALTRSGIAHLYFESIHPYEDGNGRIGRAIAEKSLAQALEDPVLIALATTILSRRKEYYQALEKVNRKNEITSWLAWFTGVVIEASRRTLAVAEFLIDKTKLLDSLRGLVNERQEKALLRMLREGPEGFGGGMSAHKYAAITGASASTTTRDLLDLVSKHALSRTGERRGARYHLAIPLRKIPKITIAENGDVLEG